MSLPVESVPITSNIGSYSYPLALTLSLLTVPAIFDVREAGVPIASENLLTSFERKWRMRLCAVAPISSDVEADCVADVAFN